MLSVTITDKNGFSSTKTLKGKRVNIGRNSDCDIVLPGTNVSKRHCSISVVNDKIIVIDLKTVNGTYVNGSRIKNPQAITEEDRVYIGDYTLEFKKSDGVEEEGSPIDHPVSMETPVGISSWIKRVFSFLR